MRHCVSYTHQVATPEHPRWGGLAAGMDFSGEGVSSQGGSAGGHCPPDTNDTKPIMRAWLCKRLNSRYHHAEGEKTLMQELNRRVEVPGAGVRRDRAQARAEMEGLNFGVCVGRCRSLGSWAHGGGTAGKLGGRSQAVKGTGLLERQRNQRHKAWGRGEGLKPVVS